MAHPALTRTGGCTGRLLGRVLAASAGTSSSCLGCIGQEERLASSTTRGASSPRFPRHRAFNECSPPAQPPVYPSLGLASGSSLVPAFNLLICSLRKAEVLVALQRAGQKVRAQSIWSITCLGGGLLRVPLSCCNRRLFATRHMQRNIPRLNTYYIFVCIYH